MAEIIPAAQHSNHYFKKPFNRKKLIVKSQKMTKKDYCNRLSHWFWANL